MNKLEKLILEACDNNEITVEMRNELLDKNNIHYIHESTNDDFDRIIEFNRKTNMMEYIIPNNGNIIYKIKSDDFRKYYKSLTPEEFVKYNGGVCWDYVIYQSYYFKKYFPNIKFKTYFHIVDNKKDLPTHTFLIFKFNARYYWFESSWKRMKGIYEFNSLTDALTYVNNKLKDGFNQFKSYLTEYNPLDSDLINITCEDYMNIMVKKAFTNNIKLPNKNITPSNIMNNDQVLPKMTIEYVEESDDGVIEERSHGSLSNSFRIITDVKTGHKVKIVFDLKKDDVVNTGHDIIRKPKNFEEVKNRIRKDGNNTFSSKATVLAIIDTETGEKLNSVEGRGPIYSNYTPIKYVVGQKENVPTFKSTSGKTMKNGSYQTSKEDLQYQFDNKQIPFLADNTAHITKARHLETNGKTQDLEKYTNRCINRMKNDANIKKKQSKNNITESSQSDLNQKCFDDFVHYVKWVQHDCDPYFAYIKPLNNFMVHKSSKGYDMLLLATYGGKLNKENCSHFLPSLSENIKYGDEKVEFNTCYLPGDIFIFIKIPKTKVVNEKGDEIMYNEITDELYEESLKDVVNSVGDKAIKSAKPINDTVNKGTEKVAKKMIRAPKADSPSHVWDEYNEKINKVKAKLKVATIATAETAVFFMPIPASSAIFNAVVLAGLKTSNDPSDKLVQKDLDKLKNKVKTVQDHIKNFFTKNKNKEFKSELEAQKEFKSIDIETAYLAKQIDSINNSKNKPQLTIESVIDIDMIDFLPRNNEEVTLEFYESVREYVEKMDVTNMKDVAVYEYMMSIIDNDMK